MTMSDEKKREGEKLEGESETKAHFNGNHKHVLFT